MKWVFPAPMKVLFDAGGFMLPQWLYAAIRLDLPDTLGQQPGRTISELAALTEVNEPILQRLMSALMHHGYFEVAGANPQTWRNSPLSAVLRREHPNSVRALVIHWLEDCYAPFGNFFEGLRAGQTPFVVHHRGRYTGFFDDYLTASPKGEERFLEAMSATHPFFEAAVLADHDWGRFKRAIDIGGSNGSFITALMRRFPTLDGVLFDRPQVIEHVKQSSEPFQSIIKGHLSFLGGDFFDATTLPAAQPG